MLSTITYRAGLNRNGYTTGGDLRHVVITIYSPLTKERVTVNTHIRVRASDFRFGKVQPTDPNHDLYNRKIARRIRRLMEYEEEMESSGITATPRKVKEAWGSRVCRSSTLGELVDGFIMPSVSRSQSTKDGYVNLVRSVEEFRPGTRLDDLCYDLIEKYRSWMINRGLAENTAIGRLKLLHSLVEEAKKRNLVADDPFKFVVIGNMRPKEATVTMAEIARLEKLKLTGREERVRDLFLLGCYCGLRFSDLTTLEEAEIKNGILKKRMYKTKKYVTIPVGTLFWGRGLEIIRKYPDITVLSHCVSCNSTFNRTIKEVALKAGIRKPLSCHYSRKACATNLSIMGMPIQNITSILGQSRTRTTETHYTFDKEKAAEKMSRKMFKARAGRGRREEPAPPRQDTREPSPPPGGEDPG